MAEETEEIGYPETQRQKPGVRELDSLHMQMRSADKVVAYNFNDYKGNLANK